MDIKHTFLKQVILLIILDLLGIICAFYLSYFVFTGVLPVNLASPFTLSAIIFPVSFYVFDLYYPFKYFKPESTLLDIIISTTLGWILVNALAYMDRSFALPRTILFCMAVLLAAIVMLVRMLYDYLLQSKFMNRRAIIIGSGQLSRSIAEVIKKTPHACIQMVGIITEEKPVSTGSQHGLRHLGSIDEIREVIDKNRIDLVIIADDLKEKRNTEAEMMSVLLKKNLIITSALHLFERLTGDVPHQFLGHHYILTLMAQVRMKPYLKIKRLTDIGLGLLLFVLLSPVAGLTIFISALTNPREIFFVQERIGKDGIPFKLLKFRTMVRMRNGEPKVTRLGKWMRKYRIDEIPQILNVLKGDMSLVGPRPEIPFFVARCRKKIPFYDAVFAIKPGLTGWAQVKYRHTTSVKDYDHKFRFNLYYLKNISFMLDMLIILKTIRIVLLGKGK